MQIILTILYSCQGTDSFWLTPQQSTYTAAVAIRQKSSCKRRVDKICKTNCYTREPCLCPPYRGRLYFIVGHFEYPYRSAAARSSSTAVVRVPPPSVGKVPISFSNAMVYLTWNMNAGQRDDFCKGVL